MANAFGCNRKTGKEWGDQMKTSIQSFILKLSSCMCPLCLLPPFAFANTVPILGYFNFDLFVNWSNGEKVFKCCCCCLFFCSDTCCELSLAIIFLFSSRMCLKNKTPESTTSTEWTSPCHLHLLKYFHLFVNKYRQQYYEYRSMIYKMYASTK